MSVAPVMLPDRHDQRRVGVVAVALCLFAGIVAASTAAFARASARATLEFGFAGVPPRFDQAVAILANNVRLWCAIAGAIVIVQSPRFGSAAGGLSAGWQAVRAVCDALLVAAAAFNAAIVGVAVGAYGARMMVAMLPHGPVELGAYALVLALYLRAREARLHLGHALRMAGLSLAGLAVAALLETFVQL